MSQALIEQGTAQLFNGAVSRELLQDFEAGQPPEALWQQVVGHGLTLALATEAAGGSALPWADAYPILRGLGYWQVPLPLAETMIGAQLLAMAGIAVPDGAIALIEAGRDGAAGADGLDGAAGVDGNLQIDDHPTNPRLTGKLQRVAWASACRWAVVSMAGAGGDTPGPGHLALINLHDSFTVTVNTRLNTAGEPNDDIELHGARCMAWAPQPLPGLRQPVRTLGAIARSAMMVGAMEWLLEQSVQYANDRVQFGRPIGKNQAIQQQLALMAGDVAAARVAALVACGDAPCASAGGAGATPESGAATLFSAAVAKVRAGEAATRATSIAHQVHGAIGFTQEHRLHFATRRLWAWREAQGSDAWWAARLGAAAIAAAQPGGAGFWPGLTARRFA